jgi:hypothetical protein
MIISRSLWGSRLRGGSEGWMMGVVCGMWYVVCVCMMDWVVECLKVVLKSSGSVQGLYYDICISYLSVFGCLDVNSAAMHAPTAEF